VSRGFVREDDQEEIPMVPQRAYLPDGVTNFVTPFGMNLLLAERKELENEKVSLNDTNEKDKRIELNYLNARLQLLNNRIAEAKIVDPGEQPKNEIRFGAIITLRNEDSGNVQTFQIVGVDEANISKGKVSFISPVSRMLINKKTGDKVALKQAEKNIVFEITGISYAS
jgi:transcription elongation factor GreB